MRPASSSPPDAFTTLAGPLVVVSPHLDDGVLSCGELLAAHPGATVLTVFAGRPPPGTPLTEWDAASGFEPGDDAIGARLDEDRRALALLGARPVWLDFLDSQYGHSPSVEALADALEPALLAARPAAVCFPLGLFHSDHKLVADACLTIAVRRPEIDQLAYEDVLYRGLPHLLEDRFAELSGRGFTFRPAGRSSGEQLARKREAVQQYASQLHALATPGRPGHADAFAPERCWWVGAAAERRALTPAPSQSREREAGASVGARFIASAAPEILAAPEDCRSFSPEGEGQGERGGRQPTPASTPTRTPGPAGTMNYAPTPGVAAAAGPDPRVGVVVLTHNRCDELDATLRQLEALPEKPEIVVVDNASRDGTAQMLRAHHPEASCIRLQRNLGAAARNVGACLCDRPYVALCDDDTWWEPGSLHRAADLLDAHPALAVVTARVLVGEDDRLDPACTPMAESPLAAPPGLPGKPLLGFLAGASMVRRAAFIAAGGFEPVLFLGGEEELLAYDLVAAGWQLAYVDELIVHHFPSHVRDAGARRRVLARNRVWVAWLRRPLLSATTETLRLLWRSVHDAGARRALLGVAHGLPWALRHRRVLPRAGERGIRQLERAGFH